MTGVATGETRPGGPSLTLGYDGHARLASYAVAGAETQAMLYNGLDERVGLTTTLGGSPVAERRYIYDAGHRITGEYGATTADLRAEYIWFLPEVGDAPPFGGDDGLGGYVPLAVAIPDGAASKIQWVQGNHLGTPVVTTDVTGAVIAPSGHDRIGFPGQVQQHADLYYNYYRDYDPTLGRYVQADPIGLEGDGNPYLYAGANPLMAIDPMGLQQAGTAPDSAAVAWEAGAKHFGRNLVRPSRKIPVAGQALLAGDALGTLAAIAWYGYINPPMKCRARDGDQERSYPVPRRNNNSGDKCAEEWREAYQICGQELSKNNPAHSLTGGYRDIGMCAKGLVSERCGGNRWDRDFDPYTPRPGGPKRRRR